MYNYTVYLNSAIFLKEVAVAIITNHQFVIHCPCLEVKHHQTPIASKCMVPIIYHPYCNLCSTMKNQHFKPACGTCGTFDGPGGARSDTFLEQCRNKWNISCETLRSGPSNSSAKMPRFPGDLMNLLKWIINRYEWWSYDFQQHIMCTVIRSAFCVVWFCFRKFDMWLFAKMLDPNGADSRGFPRYQDWNQCSSVLAKTSDCEAPCNMESYDGSGWILYYDFIVVHGFRHVFNCVLACWQWSWRCWRHILRFRLRS